MTQNSFLVFGQCFSQRQVVPNRMPASGIFQRIFGAAVEFGDLFGRKFVIEVFFSKFTNLLESFTALLRRELAELFNNLCRTHGGNLLR